jgi:hypothetical protein
MEPAVKGLLYRKEMVRLGGLATPPLAWYFYESPLRDRPAR